MVSQDARAALSRERLLAAAAAEFAARGFAGAKVDRIAAKARLNKAMIYYHFEDKAALYQAILARVFGTIADAVSTGVTAADPEEQIREFVRVIGQEAGTRPHFAAMWLRELADGGPHIDAPVLSEMRRVLEVLAGIIERGVSGGRFRPVHPLVVQVSIVGPILVFLTSAPARERLARRGEALASPDREQLLRHIERAAIGALRRPATAGLQARTSRGDRT
jgi:AcrR family transcriptional regulator